jgi:hypothetical protein
MLLGQVIWFVAPGQWPLLLQIRRSTRSRPGWDAQ